MAGAGDGGFTGNGERRRRMGMCRGCVPAVRKAQAAVIWRVEKDGSRSVVACVDDRREIGVEIYADRDKIDWEPAGYDVEYGDGDDGEELRAES